jgi:hypothetical protein
LGKIVTAHRLPSTKTLAKSVTGKKKVGQSIQFLLGRRDRLKPFHGAEHFALSLAEPDEPSSARQTLDGFHHHLVNVRAAILRELWSRELFVGVSVVDDLLFTAVAHTAEQDPVRYVLETIRDHGIHRPGFVVFPVHSVGILGAGYFQFFAKGDVSLLLNEYGIALRPQSNDEEETLGFLDSVRERFGVTQELPVDLVQHWHRSRSLTWLSSNPLLAMRTQSFPGNHYENQSLLVSKLRFAASLVFLMSSLETPPADPSARLASSSMVNNWQTLDLFHYIVFFRSPRGKRLSGNCVPLMNQSRPQLAELMDLGVELNPSYWKSHEAEGKRITAAMLSVQAGYFSTRFLADSKKPRARVHRKLSNALGYFRRSFRATPNADEALVNLGAAFEVLLTDHYSPGVGERIKRRLKLALSGEPDADTLCASVDDLYRARSEAIHTGETDLSVDLRKAQRTFGTAFLAMAERLPRVPKVSNDPIADMLGDTQRDPVVGPTGMVKPESV